MRAYLDWIKPEDMFPLLVLIGLLTFVNQQMARPDAAAYRHARRLSVGVFAVYTVLSLIAFQISGPGDLVMILIRSGLAAAVVFGFGTLILAVLTNLIGDPVNAVTRLYRAWSSGSRLRKTERLRERQARETQRRERIEQARLVPIVEAENRRKAEDAERAAAQRKDHIAEARAAVTQLYDAHADLLKDTLPPLLFKSQLETKYPGSIQPEQAWPVANAMMAEMLPLIAAGQEKQRTAEAAQQQLAEQRVEAERAEQISENNRTAISRLTQWYEQERAAIENVLPKGQQRDIVIQELHGRYDQLVKEALQEMKP